MNLTNLTATLCACLAVTTCAPSRGGPPVAAIDRALSQASGKAQPSDVVATESAYLRAIRNSGATKAAMEFGASNAVMHGKEGPVAVPAFFAQRSATEIPSMRQTRAVWMSCDGSLAISNGRYRTAAGLVGTFSTVWQRQRDRTYRFIYSLAELADPQPAPRPAQSAPKEGDIVVTAMDAVQGYVADCPTVAAPVPSPPVKVASQGATSGGGVSADRTLSWRWTHVADGGQAMDSVYFSDGAWADVPQNTIPMPQN